MATLEHVSTWTATFNEQVQTNDRTLEKTIEALNTDLETSNKQLSDPAIGQTLNNLEKVTNHIASTAETVDITTIPLRKKAKHVAVILEKIMSIVKFSIFTHF
jgi:hypothetical protein